MFISPTCCALFSLDHKTNINTASCGHNLDQLRKGATKTYGNKESWWFQKGWFQEGWRRRFQGRFQKGRLEEGRLEEEIATSSAEDSTQPSQAHTNFCGLDRPSSGRRLLQQRAVQIFLVRCPKSRPWSVVRRPLFLLRELHAEDDADKFPNENNGRLTAGNGHTL